MMNNANDGAAASNSKSFLYPFKRIRKLALHEYIECDFSTSLITNTSAIVFVFQQIWWNISFGRSSRGRCPSSRIGEFIFYLKSIFAIR